jgi:hypothetical protein
MTNGSHRKVAVRTAAIAFIVAVGLAGMLGWYKLSETASLDPSSLTQYASLSYSDVWHLLPGR